MNKQMWLPFLLGCLILYLCSQYIKDRLRENTGGWSKNVKESKQKSVFMSEYQVIKNPILDSIIGTHICKSIWLEKDWVYKPWGAIEISDKYYNLIAVIQGNEGQSLYLNQRFSIALRDTNHCPKLGYSKYGDNDLLTCRLRQTAQLDTLIFNVSNDKLCGCESNHLVGQIKFVAQK